MKRLYTLFALLGLVGFIAGCAPQDSGTPKDKGTNTTSSVPASEAPASTNK